MDEIDRTLYKHIGRPFSIQRLRCLQVLYLGQTCSKVQQDFDLQLHLRQVCYFYFGVHQASYKAQEEECISVARILGMRFIIRASFMK